MKRHPTASVLISLTLLLCAGQDTSPVAAEAGWEQIRGSTTYALYPRQFERLIEDRSTELSALMHTSERWHDLLPEFPLSPVLKMKLHCPSRITITTHAETFSWDDVQFPITFMTLLDDRHWQMRYDRQIVFLKDCDTKKIYAFCPDIRKHDLLPEKPVSPLGPGYISANFTYNIFYFYKALPRRSAIYEIWVQLGDIISNRRTFTLEVRTGRASR